MTNELNKPVRSMIKKCKCSILVDLLARSLPRASFHMESRSRKPGGLVVRGAGDKLSLQ
jgi:hypothetical protein